MRRYSVFPFLAVLLLLLNTSCNRTSAPAPYGVIPSAKQVQWQKMEYYMFVHFGPNTFTDVEWGNGRENPDVLPLQISIADNGLMLQNRQG
jgi:alpha-L-fucosidase